MRIRTLLSRAVALRSLYLPLHHTWRSRLAERLEVYYSLMRMSWKPSTMTMRPSFTVKSLQGGKDKGAELWAAVDASRILLSRPWQVSSGGHGSSVRLPPLFRSQQMSFLWIWYSHKVDADTSYPRCLDAIIVHVSKQPTLCRPSLWNDHKLVTQPPSPSFYAEKS